MELEDLPERVSEAVDGLRDRTAEAVRADGRSFFREVGKLGRRVDDASDDVRQRIDDVETALDERIKTLGTEIEDQLDTLISIRRRTTWPRRLLWIAIGAGIGVAAAYLGDPDRGKARRAQLGDVAQTRGRELADQAAEQAKVVAERAKDQVTD